LYYRKAGGDYFQYMILKEQFGLDAPATPATLENIFLKENAAAGDSWTSQPFSGTMAGVTQTYTFKQTLLAKGVAATSGVASSKDVMKLKSEFFRNGTPWYSEEYWYARGIGEIYSSFTMGGRTRVLTTTRYQVF